MNMFTYLKNVFKDYTTPTPTAYTIQKTMDGKWGIFDLRGQSLRTYTRRTDAERGATRAGYTLV